MPTPINRHAPRRLGSDRPGDDRAFAGAAGNASASTRNGRAAGRLQPQTAPSRFAHLPPEIRQNIIGRVMKDAWQPYKASTMTGYDRVRELMTECWEAANGRSSPSVEGMAEWVGMGRRVSASFRNDIAAVLRTEPDVGPKVADRIIGRYGHSDATLFRTKMRDAIQCGSVDLYCSRILPRNIRIALEEIGAAPTSLHSVNLDLGGTRPPLAFLEFLVRGPAWGKITRLHLGACSVEFDIARILGDKLSSSGLQELVLSSNSIGDAGAEAVANGLPGSKVRRLDLECCGIGHLGAMAIADSLPHCEVTDLYLHDNPIGEAGGRAIGDMLRRSRLIDLNLSSTGIGPETAGAIGRNLPGSPLRRLDLSGNPIGNAGLSALAAGLPGSLLDMLEIEECGIGQHGGESIAGFLGRSNLSGLSMTMNEMGPDAIAAIARALPESKMSVLNLSDTDIREHAFPILGRALRNSSLTALDIGRNPISDGEMEQFASGLRGSRLRVLSCDAFDDEIEALGDAIPGSDLAELHISVQDIEDETLRGFAERIAGTKLLRLEFDKEPNPEIDDLLQGKLAENRQRLAGIAALGGRAES